MSPPPKSLGSSRPSRRSPQPDKAASAEARLQLVLEASEKLSSAQDPAAIVRALLEALVPSIAEGCIVCLADASGALSVANIAHDDPEIAAQLRRLSQRSDFPQPRELDSMTSASAAIQREGRGDDHNLRRLSDLGIRSATTIPLRHGSHSTGSLTLLSSRADTHYEPIDLKVVEKLASRAALAIERTQLSEFEKRTTERLRLLQNLTSALSRAVSLADVGRIIATEVTAALSAKLATVHFSSSSGQSIAILAEDGLRQSARAPLASIDPSQAHPIAEAIRSRRPIWSDPALDEIVGSGTTATICLPLLVDDRAVGALVLGFPKGRSLDASERELVLTIASQCAQALDRARLYSEAEQAVRLRDDFLSLASHELNTPLTSLKLALGHLGRSRHEPNGLARLLGVIERQADRLGNLVTDLLDVSRLTAGTVTLEASDTDLVSVVEDTISRFSLDLERSGSTVALNAPTSIVGCWDRRRLQQVTSSLVSNAIKFGRGKPIDISIEKLDSLARLTVHDRGIGIPKERQPRIFDRFERAVATPHFGGFGVGLWLARRIVEAMNGIIRFESEPGRGSIFVVELPILAQEAEA